MQLKKGLSFIIFFLLMCIYFTTGTLSVYSQSLGDVNNNGSIDIIDALAIAQYAVQMSPSPFYTTAADVDANGGITIVDALLVAQYYVGVINQFPGAGTNPPAPTPEPTTTSSPTPDPTPPPVQTNPPGGGNCGTCNWYGTNYPICCNANSDPDGDGWGWENEQTCVTQSLCDSQGGGSSTNPPNATSAPTSPPGGGTSGSCSGSVSCPGNARCGCEIVSGLGANKQELTSAEASQYMVAAAMMQTQKMDTNYSYCDGKSGDSCCCGVTKANWFESRSAGASYSDYRSYCDAINSSRSADVSNWNRIRNYWGSKYWAVHRNGESGANNPNTDDINKFKQANDWTDSQIGNHLSDDVRFWVDVPAI